MKRKIVLSIIKWILDNYMDDLMEALGGRGKHLHTNPKRKKLKAVKKTEAVNA